MIWIVYWNKQSNKLFLCSIKFLLCLVQNLQILFDNPEHMYIIVMVKPNKNAKHE